MTRERIVIDTNVLISGLLSTTSTPAKAVEKAATKAQLVATIETLRELIERLHSPSSIATCVGSGETHFSNAWHRSLKSSTYCSGFVRHVIRRMTSSSK